MKKFFCFFFLVSSLLFTPAYASDISLVFDNAKIFSEQGKSQLDTFLKKIMLIKRDDGQFMGLAVVTTNNGLSSAEEIAERFADAPFSSIVFMYDKKENEYRFVMKQQMETYVSRANCEAIVNAKLTDGLDEKEITEIAERVAMSAVIAFKNGFVNQTMIPGNVNPDPKHFYVFGDKIEESQPEKKETPQQPKPTKEENSMGGIYLIAPCIILIVGAFAIYSYWKKSREKRRG